METFHFFTVIGAGEIRISDQDNNRCGGYIGFGFGVSWATEGFTGGVLSRSEALELANYIIKKTMETSIREQDEKNKQDKK